MFRIAAEESIPHHHESVPMRPGFAALGGLLTLAIMGAGFVWAARSYGRLAELAAPFVVIAGGILLVLVVRCRRLELTVGTRRIDMQVGPFSRLVPTVAVERVETGPATGWRCFYAESEVVLDVTIGRPVVRFPSRNPSEIERAFEELR